MIKKIFYPFGEINSGLKWAIIAFWAILFFVVFEFFHGGLIPSPTQIGKSLLDLIDSQGFYGDLVASLGTTFKAMFYSILVTMLVVYLSTIQFFKPLAQFISKCRYLTLTGLVFVFTVIVGKTGGTMADLKMSLLMFGIIPFFVTSYLSVVDATLPEERWKGYVNKKGRWGTLYEVIIIGKLDMLFEVMRQNFAISWMMITMVEGYAMSEGGVGTLIIKSTKYLHLGPVFAILILIFVLGLIFDYALSTARNILFPYLKTRK